MFKKLLIIVKKFLKKSSKSTYLIVLENNVKVSDIPTLCIYTAERRKLVNENDLSLSYQNYCKTC